MITIKLTAAQVAEIRPLFAVDPAANRGVVVAQLGGGPMMRVQYVPHEQAKNLQEILGGKGESIPRDW